MREILELSKIEKEHKSYGESSEYTGLVKKKEKRMNDTIEKSGGVIAVILFFILLFYVEDRMDALIIAVSVFHFSLYLSRREKVYGIMAGALIIGALIDSLGVW
jgi:hypothetical protein